MKHPIYLIDDVKFGIAGISTSWDYDNRATSNVKDVFPTSLTDPALGIPVRFKRDFQKQSDGVLTLELLYGTENTADGADIRVLDESNNALFTITSLGNFFFDGKDTGIPAPLGETRLKVRFDLDKLTAKFAVSGHTAGIYPIVKTDGASKVILSTSGKTNIKMNVAKNRLTRDYLAHETFLYTSDAFGDEWQLDGDFSIKSHGTYSQMDYTYAFLNGAGKAYFPVEKTTDDVIFEGYFLLPEGDDGLTVALTNGKNDVFAVSTKDHAFVAPDETLVRKFTPNVWQLVRFETKGEDILVKIDGKKCGSFKRNGTAVDGISIRYTGANTLSFTNIILENTYDIPDYCPAPKVARHPEYQVGMNICNMWREGHHFGWDRITYFKNNTPLIGPYDEGNPEVADWEIKFMTEHGVTFQHFCWYCPDSMINTPILRSRMDQALRDGFMNARYSDNMKFIIMWENNGYSNTNPEDFKNYVWKYWCEYFFTDPRYLRIDNKPLISMWSLRFIEHWGGNEVAKETIEWMKEDIKNYGCDGILFMATANDPRVYAKMSEYCDITYAYHFGSGGRIPENQFNSIDNFNRLHDEQGLAPFMQTASVGFNACPWHGAESRVPLITPEDFEKVLRRIKKHGDDDKTGAWYNKLFMMSTWNEYGEGTYIMPSHLHGFGYLDKIRKVFVPEAGECENLLPDENQQKRITTLRVPGRTMIRRLGYEASEEQKAPDTVVRTDLFDEPGGHADWVKYHETVTVEKTANGILVTPQGSNEHYSLVNWGETKALDAKEATHVRIRLRAVGKKAAIRFAYLTDEDKRWAGNKCTGTVTVEPSDDFTELTFAPGMFPTWQGVIRCLRIDNMSTTPVEIASVEYMLFTDPEKKVQNLFVNGEKIRLAFDPIRTDKGALLSLDPGRGAFRMFKLYHEWNDANRKLYVASADVEAVFTEGSCVAVINGKKTALTTAFTMRDGLPTFDIYDLNKIFGIAYTYEDNNLRVTI